MPRDSNVSVTGCLHLYRPPSLTVFEYQPSVQQTPATATPDHLTSTPKHVLLFVGGLYDSLLNPQYVADIAALFPLTVPQPWRVMHIQLTSAGRHWGTTHLDRDIAEIGLAIDYLRHELFHDPSLDIVLMGHSTGCQDIMRYLTAPNPLTAPSGKPRPKIQGAILQAPVSDRDNFLHELGNSPTLPATVSKINAIIAQTPLSEHKNVVLPLNLTAPLFGPAPVCIQRYLSQTSPESPARPSIEDFFSHDLSDETLHATFGSIGRLGLLAPSGGAIQPELLALMSDSDEYVPSHIDKARLLQRWSEVMRRDAGQVMAQESCVILNALHDISGEDWPSQEARLVEMRCAVLRYLERVVGGVSEHAWTVVDEDRTRVLKLKEGDGRKGEARIGVLKL